ncbi:sugar kinase [Ramlibacter solisilvae]|uniref:2-dehydro-3-deoxygluconokinase n=1 Tax=Ramlibacter tataouinensis TaxID=94132 RepID=A0A127JWP7_9BURK|nr:sugar kinase [Ramlibacter tataouinensis]AMO24309.1 2-dehydro-3-deoxygluconokinase [Ramlibacter tataouinensis]
MPHSFDIAALGEAMLEFNQTRPGEPQYLQGFGGDTSNAVIAAARAGARTCYLTRLGADWFGDELMALWRREGVDAGGVERDRQAHTGIYFVTHGEGGHAFSYLRAGSAASRMTPEWLPRERVQQSRILHVSGISLAISDSARETVLEAMRVAREAGTLVAFDSNLRLKLWPLEVARQTIAQAASLCDYFLPSVEDAAALSGMHAPAAILDWAHALGAPQVVLKLGAEGALASDGRRRERIAGVPVRAIDATGAGDCYCGNLLARIARGEDLFAAARYANAAAALAVQGFGAVAPLPYPREVEALL